MSDSMAGVYEVNVADKGEVVEVLAAAFSGYPVFRYVLGEEGRYFDEKIRRLVDFFAEIRFQLGGSPLLLRVEEKAKAAALVDPPHSGAFTAELRRMLNEVVEAVGTAEMARMEAYEQLCKRMAPEEAHYYLGMIGVLPQYQGQGYARQLLEYIHEMVDNDPQAMGIALNTEKPNNVPIYRHFGYEVIGEADLGPMHSWCMFRPSRTSSQ